MLEEKKEQICLLREKGMGFARIAELAKESPDNVRVYCRRHDLMKYPVNNKELYDEMKSGRACLFCGGKLAKAETGRPRRFCSDHCRRAYWKIHADEMKKRSSALYTKVCPYCGKTFQVYGNKKRKYCCHEHYLLDRYGDRNPSI